MLQRVLATEGVRSKRTVTKAGRQIGGTELSRGALFYMLRNRTYLGKIVHRDAVHEGEQDAIVGEELFAAVQKKLDSQKRRGDAASHQRTVKAPLTRKLFDAGGEAMSPTFSRGRGAKLYRYYASASLQQGAASNTDDTIKRLPAPMIEKLVEQYLARWVPKMNGSLAILNAVIITECGLQIKLSGEHRDTVAINLADGETLIRNTKMSVTIAVDVALPVKGGRRMIVPGGLRIAEPDLTLIAGLRRAHQMVKRELGQPLVIVSPPLPHDRKLIMLAFLAPDIQRDILSGR